MVHLATIKLPKSAATMPTLDQLDEAGVTAATPRYPAVEIDGLRYEGLCDEIIALVPEWNGRPDVIDICRQATQQANEQAIVDEARALLAKTDHWAVKAAEAGEPVSSGRRAYRDALRAIVSDPATFSEWPVSP